MNIRELIQIVDNQEFSEAAKPKVKQDASGNWVNADTGEKVSPTDNTIAFPNKSVPSQPTEPETPSGFAKAWDATKKGASAVGQGLKKGAVATGQALKKGAAATAQGVQKYGPGIAKGAANLATGTVKAAGDIAAQAAGGVGQAVGAAPGGFIKGFKTARSGGQFKSDQSSGPYSAPSAPTNTTPQGTVAADNTELASLKTMIAKLDQRLGNLEAGKTS